MCRKKVQGFDTELPHVLLGVAPKKHSYAYGTIFYELNAAGIKIPLLRAKCPQTEYAYTWYVPQKFLRRIYRWLREQPKEKEPATPPLMHADQQQRLWDNTLGCLLKNSQELKRYGIRRKQQCYC